MVRTRRLLLLAVMIFIFAASTVLAQNSTEVSDLKSQIEVLQKRIDQLETEKRNRFCGMPMRHSGFSDSRYFFGGMNSWDPFVEMERMQQNIHRMFEDSFSKGAHTKTISRRFAAFEPNISISQKDGLYVVKVDLPGLDKNAINVEIRGRELVLSGERTDEEAKQESGFYRQELSYGSFTRSIFLPEDAQTNQISSEYKNGVLTITIPRETAKKSSVKPRKVPVL